MFCTNCGKMLSDGIKFCPYCGAPVLNLETKGDSNKSLKAETDFNHYSNGETSVKQPDFQTTVQKPQVYEVKPDRVKVNNIYVWIMAIVPLILNVLLSDVVSPSVLSIMLAFFNLILVILDSMEVEHAGIKTGKLMWILAVLFVPTYLFYRAYKVDKRYSYAITWCVLFVLVILALG